MREGATRKLARENVSQRPEFVRVTRTRAEYGKYANVSFG